MKDALEKIQRAIEVTRGEPFYQETEEDRPEGEVIQSTTDAARTISEKSSQV